MPFNAWFTLIVASSLFTWQHHLLDVVTGAMLGQICTFAFPGWHEHVLVRSASANFRVARLFAVGSAVLGIMAIALGSWFWLLVWPASSLALIAIAYLRGNSSVFRKSGGSLPISTRVVLGPYLFGAYVRLLIYRRRGEPWVEAAPGVFCGRLLTKREALAVRSRGVTGVLDLTAEHPETRAFFEIEYLNVPVLDLTSPSREQFDVAVAFIADHADGGGVYVHCALGISRSVAAVAAYIDRGKRNQARFRRLS